MNHPHIDIFNYSKEIKLLSEEWMVDMAIVYREFDEDKDGIISELIAKHIFRLFRLPFEEFFNNKEKINLKDFLYEARVARDELFFNSKKRY